MGDNDRETVRAGIATAKAVSLPWPTRPVQPLPQEGCTALGKGGCVRGYTKVENDSPVCRPRVSCRKCNQLFQSVLCPGKLKTCFTGLASRWTSFGLSDKLYKWGERAGCVVDPAHRYGLQFGLSTHKSDRHRHGLTSLQYYDAGVHSSHKLVPHPPTSRDTVCTSTLAQSCSDKVL